ncbi:2'-5' RNA ligase family protein [Albibacterium indicum]|uniref:2'-5' RNA ligase family protein n=1 Tax=Albibacterium indicum TaxID=2292082 RepID=UPI000E4D5887
MSSLLSQTLFKSFPLSDFGSFQNETSTIYLHVENEEQFSRIPQYLQMHLRPALTPVKGYSLNFIKKGHLTIARRIPENEFNGVWPYRENMRYHADSDANRIVFLRKRLSATRSTTRPHVNQYEVVGDYPFLGKGISDAQLKLF